MLNYDIFTDGMKRMKTLANSEKYDKEGVAMYYDVIKDIITDQEFLRTVVYVLQDIKGSGFFPSTVEFLGMADDIKPDKDIPMHEFIVTKEEVRKAKEEYNPLTSFDHFMDSLPARKGSIGGETFHEDYPVMIEFNGNAKKWFPGWRTAVDFVVKEFWPEEKEEKHSMACSYVRRQGFYIPEDEYEKSKPIKIKKRNRYYDHD